MTALSLLDGLAHLTPHVVAALSAPGVSALRLPKRPGELLIAPDPDPAGADAARTLARRAHAEGWQVRIMAPPPGGGDWNDAAMKEASHEHA